jgi:N-6 DNA Methylase
MLQNDIVSAWRASQPLGKLGFDGLLSVVDPAAVDLPPDERLIMEKAKEYGADYVFFRAREARKRVADALIFDHIHAEDSNGSKAQFALLHRRLWSWSAVPLLYRRLRGKVDLFRCGHRPDFYTGSDAPAYKPFQSLQTAADVTHHLEEKPWWDFRRLSNGTIWDSPSAAEALLSGDAAHATLLKQIKELDAELAAQSRLRETLRRRLLITSLLVAYLEDRDVFKLQPGFFARYKSGAERFFDVLPDAEALIRLLSHLERERFNGNVFSLTDDEKSQLRQTRYLPRFAQLIEGKTEDGRQSTLWRLYSFRDLPVELISHIYQHFVQDRTTCVYTPPFLARLMLEEALTSDRMDRLTTNDEVVLDPACGSGVFLVETFKRLALHWRARNEWRQPSVDVLRNLLMRVCGVDLDPSAIELASFSLCLALCEELKAKTILNTGKLFPKLRGVTLREGCFFELKSSGTLPQRIGLVVGNPPFESELRTTGIRNAYLRYQNEFGRMPDKQSAYLFLHEAIQAVAPNGLLCLLQQYGFLYNSASRTFRQRFLRHWRVKEILDLVPIRGLFAKDTKVVVVLAEAEKSPSDYSLLHAIFRRTVQTDAQHSFELDYYDMHWVRRSEATSNDYLWRCNLFGGGRAIDMVRRLKKLPTLKQFADAQGWEFGEGYASAHSGRLEPGRHLLGQALLPSTALTKTGIDEQKLTLVPKHTTFRSAYSDKRFTPPLTLLGRVDDFRIAYWTKSYLAYTNQVAGIAANGRAEQLHRTCYLRLEHNRDFYSGWLALTGGRAGIGRSTALYQFDLENLPYPKDEADLALTPNEQIVLNDARDYYRMFLRLGDQSEMMRSVEAQELLEFGKVFANQINAIYETLQPIRWIALPGIICFPFAFGDAKPDWNDEAGAATKLDQLIRGRTSETLTTVRLVRLFEGPFVFVLKPNRLRYWLRSIALRDADETLADLRVMGF